MQWSRIWEWPREKYALLLQIILQPLLNVLQDRKRLAQIIEQSVARTRYKNVRLVENGRHEQAPHCVNSAEFGRIARHLTLDVLRTEDWFQVQPSALDLVTEFAQSFLELFHHSWPDLSLWFVLNLNLILFPDRFRLNHTGQIEPDQSDWDVMH